MGLIQAAEEKYYQMVHMEMGELKIGASDTVIANFLLPYLEKYHKLYPDINIKVTNKTTYESLRLLRNGSVDVCFINLPIAEDEDLEVTPCIEIHDVLVGGRAVSDACGDGHGVEGFAEISPAFYWRI